MQHLDEQVLRLRRFPDQSQVGQAAAGQRALEAADPHLVQSPLQIAHYFLNKWGSDGFQLGV